MVGYNQETTTWLSRWRDYRARNPLHSVRRFCQHVGAFGQQCVARLYVLESEVNWREAFHLLGKVETKAGDRRTKMALIIHLPATRTRKPSAASSMLSSGSF